jgi:hypothetical protein
VIHFISNASRENSARRATTPLVVDLFLSHISQPTDLRVATSPWQNAIEYRSLLIVGDQAPAKLACRNAQRSTDRTIRRIWSFAGIQVAGIDKLLSYATSRCETAWFLVREDLAPVKLQARDGKQIPSEEYDYAANWTQSRARGHRLQLPHALWNRQELTNNIHNADCEIGL